jgi:hypothetical protein
VLDVMTTEEMQAAIVKIARGDGHGYIKAAAAALNVTPRTINNALRGKITQPFSTKVRDRIAEIEARGESGIGLIGQAGTWSVGHVTHRQTGRDVIDEAVVTHLATPFFVFHLAMVRGKDKRKHQKWEKFDRWLEEPSSEVVRIDLLDQAREMAEDFIDARSKSLGPQRIREKKWRRSA